MAEKPDRLTKAWAKLKKWLLGATGIAGAVIVGIAYIGETPEGDWRFQRTLVKNVKIETMTALGDDSTWRRTDTLYDTITIPTAILAKMLLPDEFTFLDSLRKAAPDTFNARIAAIFDAYMGHKTAFKQARGVFTARTFLGTDTLVTDTASDHVAITWQGDEWFVEPRWDRIKEDVYDYTGIYDSRYESNWICKGAVNSLGHVVDPNPVYYMREGIYKARLARGTRLDPTYGSTDILRSVGKSGIVEDNHGGAVSLTVSGDTAYFTWTLADSVGVGDCIVYGDTMAFIHRRLNDSAFKVKTDEGGMPTAASGIDSWSIYRAYTSLANAENGIRNGNIPKEFLGGNLNLTALNKAWHIACYKDKTDTFNVTIDGWTCDSANYLRIFTPVKPYEAGKDQRHTGIAGTGYRLAPTIAGDGIRILDNYVRIEGIEVTDWTTNSGGSFDGINIEADKALIEYVIVHDDGHDTVANSDANGINLEDVNNATCTVRNSIVFGIARSGITIHQNIVNSVLNIENCTVYRCLERDNSNAYGCVVLRGSTNDTINARNVIGIDTLAANKDFAHFAYAGCVWGNSSNNISSDSSAPGPNSQYKKTASSLFQSAVKGSENLHLLSGAPARSAAVNLSSSFIRDMDGQIRTGAWDIGADEYIICGSFFVLTFGDTALVDTFVYSRDTTAGEPDSGLIDTVTQRRVKGDTVFTDSILRVEIRNCSLHVDSLQIRRMRDSILLTIDTCEWDADTLSRDTLGNDTIVLAGDSLLYAGEFCSTFDYDSTVFAADTTVTRGKKAKRYISHTFLSREYFLDAYTIRELP